MSRAELLPPPSPPRRLLPFRARLFLLLFARSARRHVARLPCRAQKAARRCVAVGVPWAKQAMCSPCARVARPVAVAGDRYRYPVGEHAARARARQGTPHLDHERAALPPAPARAPTHSPRAPAPASYARVAAFVQARVLSPRLASPTSLLSRRCCAVAAVFLRLALKAADALVGACAPCPLAKPGSGATGGLSHQSGPHLKAIGPAVVLAGWLAGTHAEV